MYYLSPAGEVARLIEDLPNPNGVILSPDEEEMKRARSSMDLIIDTVPVAHPIQAYLPLLDMPAPEDALDALDSLRLLTVTRVGPTGAVAMNQRILEHLARRRNLEPTQTWYHGRPVIVLHNDYRVGLFNGDTGVCLAGNDGHPRRRRHRHVAAAALLGRAVLVVVAAVVRVLLRLTVLARRHGLVPLSSPTRTSPISESAQEEWRYVLSESVKVPYAMLFERSVAQ